MVCNERDDLRIDMMSRQPHLNRLSNSHLPFTEGSDGASVTNVKDKNRLQVTWDPPAVKRVQ
jgi:hypothetical protein